MATGTFGNIARVLGIVLLALTSALPLAAQQNQSSALSGSAQPGLRFGLKAGVNVADFRHDEARTEIDPRIGVIAGGGVAGRLRGVFGWQVEALYSAKGKKFRVSNTTIAIDYLEIPSLVTVGSSDHKHIRPMFVTGPAVAFKVRARYGALQFPTDFVRGTELGWVLGGGIDGGLHGGGSLTLEGRYTLGLTKVFDADPSDSDADIRNRVFSVLLGYQFP